MTTDPQGTEPTADTEARDLRWVQPSEDVEAHGANGRVSPVQAIEDIEAHRGNYKFEPADDVGAHMIKVKFALFQDVEVRQLLFGAGSAPRL